MVEILNPVLRLMVSRLGQQLPLFPAQQTKYLLPKLRGQFAEFLEVVSLAHLRLLALTTCVGLRYGYPGFNILKAFLVSKASVKRLHPKAPPPVRFQIAPTSFDRHIT